MDCKIWLFSMWVYHILVFFLDYTQYRTMILQEHMHLQINKLRNLNNENFRTHFLRTLADGSKCLKALFKSYPSSNPWVSCMSSPNDSNSYSWWVSKLTIIMTLDCTDWWNNFSNYFRLWTQTWNASTGS